MRLPHPAPCIRFLLRFFQFPFQSRNRFKKFTNRFLQLNSFCIDLSEFCEREIWERNRAFCFLYLSSASSVASRPSTNFLLEQSKCHFSSSVLGFATSNYIDTALSSRSLVHTPSSSFISNFLCRRLHASFG